MQSKVNTASVFLACCRQTVVTADSSRLQLSFSTRTTQSAARLPLTSLCLLYTYVWYDNRVVIQGLYHIVHTWFDSITGVCFCDDITCRHPFPRIFDTWHLKTAVSFEPLKQTVPLTLQFPPRVFAVPYLLLALCILHHRLAARATRLSILLTIINSSLNHTRYILVPGVVLRQVYPSIHSITLRRNSQRHFIEYNSSTAVLDKMRSLVRQLLIVITTRV